MPVSPVCCQRGALATGSPGCWPAPNRNGVRGELDRRSAGLPLRRQQLWVTLLPKASRTRTGRLCHYPPTPAPTTTTAATTTTIPRAVPRTAAHAAHAACSACCCSRPELPLRIPPQSYTHALGYSWTTAHLSTDALCLLTPGSPLQPLRGPFASDHVAKPATEARHGIIAHPCHCSHLLNPTALSSCPTPHPSTLKTQNQRHLPMTRCQGPRKNPASSIDPLSVVKFPRLVSPPVVALISVISLVFLSIAARVIAIFLLPLLVLLFPLSPPLIPIL